MRYFVAVAEHESISRAARRLNLSQPPLSRQIRDLEAELGVPLFRRDPRRLLLTGPGEVFLEEARAVLRHFEDGVVRTREAGNRDGAKIRVGHSAASSIKALPRILCEFHKLHPEAKVELRRLRTAEMITSLRRGEIDACLTICGSVTDLAPFDVERLCTYGLVAAVPHQHPLASAETISLRDFARQPILSLNKVMFKWYNEFISDLLIAHNPRFEVAEEHDGTESIIAAVEAERGVALVYDVMASSIGDRLALRPLTPSPPEAPLVLFYRSNGESPLTAKLVKAAKTAIQIRSYTGTGEAAQVTATAQ